MKCALPPVRILYLDDSASDTLLITSLLENAQDELPSVVNCVSTREQFLAALKPGAFDLILSDHRMPKYDGDAALRDVMAICPDVPFIMVTGEMGEERAVETLKHGATDYVLKDHLGRLVPSIGRALRDAAAERERRKIAQSLVEAQRMAHIGNWEWNLKTGELHWSRELYSIYGLDPDTFAPSLEAFARYVHPDDRTFVAGKVEQVISTGNSVDFDFRIVRADGTVRVLRTIGEVRQFDAEGKPLVMAGANQDITERTEAARQLAESESRLRAYQEASLDGFTILRPVHDGRGEIVDFTWVYENAAVARMNGTVPGEVVGRRLLELFPGHRNTRFFEAYCQAAVTGKSVEFEEHYRGETITTDTWFRVVVVPAGDTVVVVAQDITARRQMEDALRQSELRYRMLYETLRDAFVRVEMDGRIIECNDIYCQMLGYSCDEIKRLSYQDVTPERWRGFENHIVQEQIIQRGYSDVYEKEYRCKDGTIIPVELRTILARDEKGEPNGMWAIVRDISERKKVENALRASEERFKSVLANSRDVIYCLNVTTGRFEYISPAAEEVTGYTVEEFLAMDNETALSMIHPDDLPAMRAAIARLEETGLAEAEYRQRTRNGEYRWLSNRMSYTRDDHGQVQLRIGNIRDISKGKEIEQELRRSRQHLEDMIRYAPTFIYEIDFRTRRFTEVNEAMCAFSGYSREEMLARDPMDFLYEESRVRFKERIAQWLRGERPQEDIEYHVKLREGRDRWVILKVTFIADEKGRPLGATVIGHDITERRRMEEALRESEEKFRALSESSPTAVLVYRGNKHLYVNAAAEKIFGYPHDELLSIDFIELIHPDDRAIVGKWALARATGEKMPARYEARIVTKEGMIKWLDVSSTLIQYEGKPAGIVSCVDITDKKQLEETLQRNASNLRLMVQAGIRPMMVVNRDGLVEAISEAGALLLGYRERELIGRNVEELVVPLSRMEAALQLRDLRQQAPRPLTATLRLLRKDASSFWATVEVSLVVAGDGVTEKYLAKFEKLEVSSAGSS